MRDIRSYSNDILFCQPHYHTPGLQHEQPAPTPQKKKKSWVIASYVLFIFSLLHFATYFELFIALFEK